MCGIVGILSFDNSSYTVSDERIVNMRDVLQHRGPDGAGAWVSSDRKMGLGHRRLSIIDLSESASQPMPNADRTLWISFNGEIYNHAEIRRELERIGGYTWKTDHSDTEVILHAFEEWGIDCVHRFSGMFAIAVWDSEKRELWLIRDRVGIKPVYYSIYNGRIAFASEIKALLTDPDLSREINQPGLFNFLSFMTVPAPETLFAGIHKLPSATWMRVRANGDIKEHRYWDALDHAPSLTGASEDEIAERILAELKSAVQLRKIGDVPVGVFLSGGIDSSTNTALFSDGGAPPVKTFSIGYEGEYESYKNELDFARMAAEHSGAHYHDRLLNMDDLVDFLPQLVYQQDEPIADPVCMPLYYVSKLARDNGVTVCQVGEGADELFCGYDLWHTLNKLQRFNRLPIPNALKRAGLPLLARSGRQFGFDYEWLWRASKGLPIFWGGAEAYTHQRKLTLVPSQVHESFSDAGSWDSIKPIHDRFLEKSKDPSLLNWMSYLDLNNRLPELLLMRVDKMSMATSLEARVPFLDHKFVELAMGIPSSMKITQGVGKHILRKAVRGTIPDEIIDRKKQGFGLPLHDWFQTHFHDYAAQKIRAFCDDTGLLNYAPIADIMALNKSHAVWPILNLALWWDCYFVKPANEQDSLKGQLQ